ncbi:hypothetical protein DBV15_04987, partial [Temnothorax longispinosus]
MCVSRSRVTVPRFTARRRKFVVQLAFKYRDTTISNFIKGDIATLNNGLDRVVSKHLTGGKRRAKQRGTIFQLVKDKFISGRYRS